jgi:putative transposase
MKTYSLRIFPTQQQIRELNDLSSIYVEIWNNLIDIQQNEYKNNKKIFNKFDLNNKLPDLKNQNVTWKKLNSKCIQTIATTIFSSYRSFFTLIKKDKSSRPPNKLNNDKFHTLTYNQSGWSFKNNLLYINKIPFKFKGKQDYSKENIKEIRVKFVNNKWLVDLVINDKILYPDKIEKETKILSVDLGLKNLGNCIDNKGQTILIHNKSKKINKYFSKQINKIKSKLSKKKKHSKSYNQLNKTKRKLLRKKNAQIKQTLHIQSKKLSDMNYNTIVIGDLTVKKLMNKEKNKMKGLRKSFHDSNISTFLNYLTYKCQNKNINLLKINETNTTQLNCLTGKKFPTKVDLSQREVNITNDIILDRDINSAINILKRYQEHHLASVNEPFVVTTNVLLEISKRKHISL